MSVIQPSDIKVYLSGGGTNTDPNASLGGERSTTEMVDNNLHNLFAKVDATEAAAGSTKYRGVYVRNEHGSLTLQDAIAFVSAQSTSTDTHIELGVAAEVTGVEMATIADEDTAPASISGSWISAVGEANGSNMDSFGSNVTRGLWVKRVVAPGANAFGNDTAKYGVRGETTST